MKFNENDKASSSFKVEETLVVRHIQMATGPWSELENGIVLAIISKKGLLSPTDLHGAYCDVVRCAEMLDLNISIGEKTESMILGKILTINNTFLHFFDIIMSLYCSMTIELYSTLLLFNRYYNYSNVRYVLRYYFIIICRLFRTITDKINNFHGLIMHVSYNSQS